MQTQRLKGKVALITGAASCRLLYHQSGHYKCDITCRFGSHEIWHQRQCYFTWVVDELAYAKTTSLPHQQLINTSA